ncbi:restriction endonuclease subunit S [Thermococcus sp. MV5]|uniref:restriction endonuclease subunit S n=1 Tax=Thermococcus sp. MV5 TaxID=1638272 RepID=UPI00143C977E|nr:restriction endonuclease subunit S [Thermococcus sp. MV5]NJE26614.1 restriction endonuclease subunit S [Thermococcus sp. MV5]
MYVKFKKTPIGEIPEDWDVKSLSEVAEYINGYAFSPKDWKDKGLPIIRIQNLNDLKAEFNYFDGEIDEKYIVENGDLLFSWSASIGVYLWNRGKAVLNQHIFKVIPKRGIDKLYLYYAMFLAIEQLKNRIHGSTMKHFKKGELKRTFIPLPPLPEQKKIAQILRTVDEAIEKTDLAIEKTERLKKGLMQRLLTKGIKHERFKKTEIGEIPEEWRVVKLGEVTLKIKTGPFGSQLRKSELTEEGIKVYTQENVLKKDFSIGNTYISLKKFEELKSMEVNPGDVLLTIRGTVGKAAVVPDNAKIGIIHTNLALIRTNLNELLPEYLERIINDSKLILNQIRSSRSSTTLPALYAGTIRRLKIPLPPLPEQKKIAEILMTVDKKLELLRKRKEKLERIKKGLMKDLLTGRRRVKV